MVVKVEYFNEVFIRLICDPGVMQELSEYFTFMVPNARFMPKFRAKLWDGKIALVNRRTGLLYAGLRSQVERFCVDRQYEYEEAISFADEEFSIHEAKEWIKKQKFPLEPRDYQIEAFTKAVRSRRGVFLSPTASGKSFIIYMLSAYLGLRTLIVVPTISLVGQMRDDFISYGCDPDEIHCIHAGTDKASDKQFVITTWQSVYKLQKQWFRQFECVVGDEAHLFKANSLTSIMEKMIGCGYRYGFTGTLDGSLTNKMVLEGLFGPVHKVTTTAKLMDEGHVANLKIKCIVLEYPEEIRKQMKGSTYHDEVSYIVSNERRNRFIANLAHSLEGNVLVLFRYIELQGDQLIGAIRAKDQGRSGIYYVTGDMAGEGRNSIRSLVETQHNAIIVASMGVFSTGINIKNLHSVILASPSKSRIAVLQSIGRGLRKSESKDNAQWFDIADDLSWKSHRNHTLKHYAERIKIYNEEKFDYKQYKVAIK